MEAKEIVFNSDTSERKKWFKGTSFAHPAKMVLGLQMYLIEHYTKEGETILDPMSGSGSVLVACALSRNVICVELESKFVKMQQDNWEKIKSMGAMLGYKMGSATILQGDARKLPELLADKCIFSPPYAEVIVGADKNKCAQMERKSGKRKWGKTLRLGQSNFHRYADKTDTNNIGNLPYGSISAVVTSPPYEGSLEGGSRHTKGGIPERGKRLGQSGTYADVVCTSPPYEGSLQGKPGIDWTKCDNGKRDRTKEAAIETVVATHSGYDVDPSIKRLRKHKRTDPKAGGDYGRSLGHPYSGNGENIGNLVKDNYLSAMYEVYCGCYRILKENGLLILVTKNFIRNKQIVRLDLDTIKLCEQAGFTLQELLKRKLTQQSFWRRIYEQKYPNAPKIEYEDILIFRKAR